MGRFDFVQAKFPELAEYGNKAESFFNSDPETCGYHLSRVFESSIEIICSLNNVSTKESDGKDREKKEIIDELQNTGVIDSNIARTLTNMRRTRNKVAHNDNITSSEISAFFQDSLSVCNWLMQNGRGSVKSSTRPQSTRTESQPSIHGVLTVDEIEGDYCITPIVAKEKYEGKRITVKGLVGSIGEDSVSLEDFYGYVYCYFNKNEKDFLRKLNPGQNFMVTGTWCYDDYGNHCLKNCQVPSTTLETQTTAKTKPTPPKPQESSMPTLHQAVSRNQPKIVETLLQNGADVNAKNEDGETALHLAVIDNQSKIVEILLRHGADVNATDKEGMTALDWSEVLERSEIHTVLFMYSLQERELQGSKGDTVWNIIQTPSVILTIIAVALPLLTIITVVLGLLAK